MSYLFTLLHINAHRTQYSAWMASGVTSTITSTILVGIFSQVWLRKYHPGWFRKYNYILGGALDGGAQLMIFILSFAVFGASGMPRPFPSVGRSVVPRLTLTDELMPLSGPETLHRATWIIVMGINPFLKV